MASRGVRMLPTLTESIASEADGKNTRMPGPPGSIIDPFRQSGGDQELQLQRRPLEQPIACDEFGRRRGSLLPSSRPPDFGGTRAFLSPLLGCRAKCGYCYIRSFGYHQRIGVPNAYGLTNSMRDLQADSRFVSGARGTIISVGAWGDPFPERQDAERAVSLEWVLAAMSSGNPVQVMSRFDPGAEILTVIADAQLWAGQVLYSTSITTATRWELFERYSAPPVARMEALRTAKSLGISTNVMVKPFIPAVTGSSAEVEAITNLIRASGANTVVVGDYIYDRRIDTIIRALEDRGGIEPISISSKVGYPLECAGSSQLDVIRADQDVIAFVAALRSCGIQAFRKSACATAWTQCADPGLRGRPEILGLCVECGLCDPNPVGGGGPPMMA